MLKFIWLIVLIGSSPNEMKRVSHDPDGKYLSYAVELKLNKEYLHWSHFIRNIYLSLFLWFPKLFFIFHVFRVSAYIYSCSQFRHFLSSCENGQLFHGESITCIINIFTLCRTGFVSCRAGIDDLSVCVSSSAFTCVWRRRSRWPAAVTAAYRTWRCWGWWRCESQTTRMDVSASSSTTTTTKDYSCRYPYHLYSKHFLQTLLFHPQILLKKPTWELATVFFKKNKTKKTSKNNTMLF